VKLTVMKFKTVYCIFACFFTYSQAIINNARVSQSTRSKFAEVPSFPLHNAAEPGLNLPAVGAGTGFYGRNILPYGEYPECGADLVGCGNNTQKAVYIWLTKANGVRLDCANSYYNQRSVARGIEQSGINRSQIFILSKVGPSYPLGYNETLQQTFDILQELQTDYIDLMLVHWPLVTPSEQIPISSDPLCNLTASLTYNERKCRLSTWSAMIVLFQRGLVRSIGVSNYNTTHLQEIIDAGLPLPTANQVSFNPYNYRTGRADLLQFCQKHQILLIGYSPLGVPDVHQFPTENRNKQPTGMSRTLLEDPVIVSLAKEYNRTPAQVLIRWAHQLGVPTNPRSMSETHMLENLAVFSNPFTITDNDMNRINNLAQDTCDADPDWYECVGNGNFP
jgi:diketogulonate reductase-like aldo/keto reductase